MRSFILMSIMALCACDCDIDSGSSRFAEIGAPCRTDADCGGCTGPGECDRAGASPVFSPARCYGGELPGCTYFQCHDLAGTNDWRCRVLPDPDTGEVVRLDAPADYGR